MQTCGHVAGAAFYYQPKNFQDENWPPSKPMDKGSKFIGLSLHPVYGGHFAFRSVLIFPEVKIENSEKSNPGSILEDPEEIKTMLEEFNFNWRTSGFRDFGNPKHRYSPEQVAYFGLAPAERWAFLEMLVLLRYEFGFRRRTTGRRKVAGQKERRDEPHLLLCAMQAENGVDAMDQLLQSCHSSPSLPQFSESHLRMVQKLLESSIPKLEQLATDSFVTFSNIEESSPSYHRQYDFFISKFSQMCHASSDKYGEEAMKIRCAGLKGLRGVVWKSVTDELHPNIWEPQHMDKIVPSILFNLQASFESTEKEKTPVIIFDAGFNNGDHEPEENAKSLSDRCLRELMGKASFASLRPVIEPVLTHMDLHTKWNPPPNFAVHVFRAIIYSIQSQNSYFVIQELINHLDKLCRAEANVRIGIATVLSNIVSIAGTSIGPLLLSIFSSLLRHLKTSVDYERSGGNTKQGDDFLIHVLVKTLLKVATKYRTAYLATVFTDSFLNTLIQLGLVADAKVRLIIQRIFHTLLDRHDNLMHVDKLPYVLDVADVQLTVEKCSRADQMFMRKHIADIAQMLYKAACMVSNDDPLNHLNAIQCTMSLLCIEAGFDETLIELFRLCLALQATAIEKVNEYSETKCAGIHNIIARYINLAAQLTANPSLCQHVQQVVSTRAQSGPHSMNLLIEDDDSKEAIEKQRLSEKDGKERIGLAELDKNGMLFLAEDIGESLKAAGKDISKLSLPFISTQSNVNQKTKGDVDSDSGDEIDGSKTPLPQTAGIDDVSVDLSVDWTPPPSNKHSRRNTVFSLNIPSSRIGTLGLPLNVDTLKSYASTPLDQDEEEKRANDLHFAVLNDIRTIPFEERVAAAEARSEVGELSKTVARLLVRNQEKVMSSALFRRASLICRQTRLFHGSIGRFLPVVQFKLSDIGEGIAEVQIKEWYVKEGDQVVQFDNLCEVQSDKAAVTITSRYDGTIKKLYYKVDEMAFVGKPLIDIDVASDVAESAKSELSKVEQEKAPKDEKDAPKTEETRGNQSGGTLQHPGKVLATPAVRRIAIENKIDLKQVPATGKDGRVLKEDVLKFLGHVKSDYSSGTTNIRASPSTHFAGHHHHPIKTFSPLAEDNVVPIRGYTRAMIKTMTEALKIPHFGYNDEINVDELVKIRRELKELGKERGVKVSYMPLFIKAASLALLEFPSLNATVDEKLENVIHKASHNICLAMDTPGGLVVPNIKHVEQRSIFEIASELDRLIEAGKRQQISRDDLTGGTFTLSNIGAIGGTYASPVIFPPQVAIGAIGKIEKLPKFDHHDNVYPAHVVKISWAADHRVVDGATMARFSNRWKSYLEKPATMLAQLK
ncbi:hypothetical protein WR25_12229 [Diploscapter pachys]|uniref:Lipoamide acyltransferase component of branched-chain alpha-keto acid dehydrogenase complex, mitochondrial n=1 Tax=Diploscapter pachys TaxID=2018661 RepID=A0A2A2KC75_9BILA|nr:hypothetical protein WR25_12229 [Diploscapter pachys]